MRNNKLKIINKWLNGKNTNIERKSIIWNMISSIEYSIQSAILLMVITRILGLETAGVFTIAYAVTQMMATIGSYAMRSFQVSDTKEEYGFNTYYTSRLVSTGAMIVICFGYSIIQGYGGIKLVLVGILCAYRAMEGIEDVIHGEIQRKRRLDVASKIIAVRIFLATLLFAILLLFTKNIVYASLGLSLGGIIISFVLNYSVIYDGSYENISFKIESKNVLKLLMVCLPICVGGFLYNYLGNAPKYAIDRNLSDELQTIFNVLFILIFTINMLSSFIFKPMVLRMGELWNDNRKKEFVKLIVRQLLIIVGLTVTIVVAGEIIGLDLLEWIYAVNLEKYRKLFTFLLLFGGLSAMSAYLNVVLTIMRKQIYIIIAYIGGFVADLILLDKLTVSLKLEGAGLGYGISMFVVVMVMSCVIISNLFKNKK